MIDRVECFSSVEEEKEALFLFDHPLEEEMVEIGSVIHSVLAPEETSLRGVYELGDGGHHDVGESSGENAVICVGDTDWAGVGDKACVFLWNEEEEPIVKAGRGRLTATEGVHHG